MIILNNMDKDTYKVKRVARYDLLTNKKESIKHTSSTKEKSLDLTYPVLNVMMSSVSCLIYVMAFHENGQYSFIFKITILIIGLMTALSGLITIRESVHGKTRMGTITYQFFGGIAIFLSLHVLGLLFL